MIREELTAFAASEEFAAAVEKILADGNPKITHHETYAFCSACGLVAPIVRGGRYYCPKCEDSEVTWLFKEEILGQQTKPQPAPVEPVVLVNYSPETAEKLRQAEGKAPAEDDAEALEAAVIAYRDHQPDGADNRSFHEQRLDAACRAYHAAMRKGEGLTEREGRALKGAREHVEEEIMVEPKEVKHLLDIIDRLSSRLAAPVTVEGVVVPKDYCNQAQRIAQSLLDTNYGNPRIKKAAKFINEWHRQQAVQREAGNEKMGGSK
jgi:hypothetical protein